MRPFMYSLCCLVLSGLGSSPATPPVVDPPAPSSLIVGLAKGQRIESVMRDLRIPLRTSGAPHVFSLSEEDGYYVLFPSSASNAWYEQLKRHPSVRLAQWNHSVASRNIPPDDPYWEAQWNVRRIGIPQVWESTFLTPQIRDEDQPLIWVGVLEKHGFDTQHADLKPQFWKHPAEIPGDQIDNDQNGYIDDVQGWNFQLNQSIHPPDPHGTQVAGLIAARTNNRIGMAGLTRNTGLIPLSGLHYEHQIVQAYMYLRDLRRAYNQSKGERGALVVAANASFGVNYGQPDDYPIWCEVFDKLGQEGILSVSSVMNAPVNIDQASDIPTSCSSDFLITVTESDINDHLPTNVGYGRRSVDLAAPGRGSFSTFPRQQYGNVNQGTSFAAPHVSGTIAMLYEAMCGTQQRDMLETPDAMALQIKSWILEGAEQLPAFRDQVGARGRLNAFSSYQIMQRSCLPEGTPTLSRQIYPNPFSEQVQIVLTVPDEANYLFDVFDIQGQLVKREHKILPPGKDVRTSLDLSALPVGMYHLTILGGNHRTVHRIVKTSQ